MMLDYPLLCICTYNIIDNKMAVGEHQSYYIYMSIYGHINGSLPNCKAEEKKRSGTCRCLQIIMLFNLIIHVVIYMCVDYYENYLQRLCFIQGAFCNLRSYLISNLEMKILSILKIASQSSSPSLS